MKKAQYNESQARWVTVPWAGQQLCLSRGQVLKLAESKGALKRIGRSVRIDMERILED